MRGPDLARTNRSRSLRKADNDAEGALWSDLRGRRLNEQFVRQHLIGHYYAEFACRKARLVVEVDGSQHANDEGDRVRDNFMVSEGWSVLRIWNVDVLSDRAAVLDTIVAALECRLEPDVVSNDLRFVARREYRERFQ